MSNKTTSIERKSQSINATLAGLAAAGAFTKTELIEESIKFKSGGETHEFTVFIRPLSYRSAVSEISAARLNKDALAARIAASVCDEKGNAIFTIEDVNGEADPDRGPLSNDMTIALLDAISRANGMGKPQSR